MLIFDTELHSVEYYGAADGRKRLQNLGSRVVLSSSTTGASQSTALGHGSCRQSEPNFPDGELQNPYRRLEKKFARNEPRVLPVRPINAILEKRVKIHDTLNTRLPRRDDLLIHMTVELY
jgi:hypothetical protein